MTAGNTGPILSTREKMQESTQTRKKKKAVVFRRDYDKYLVGRSYAVFKRAIKTERTLEFYRRNLCYFLVHAGMDTEQIVQRYAPYVKAVKDRDFENARAEEGFRRIIEVVVLESIRQGYDYVGKIVWVTGIDKVEVEDAIMRLSMKGLLTRREKRNITGLEEYYELTKDIADKVGVTKKVGLFNKKEVSAPMQQLKDISEVLGRAKDSVERGDLEATKQAFDELISPAKHGSAMIEQFFEEHRDLRLAQIRLRDKGQEYLNANKSALSEMVSRIDMIVRKGPVSKSAKD